MNEHQLLDLIGSARGTYVLQAQQHREPSGKVRRISLRRVLLIAAVITMLVALVGFAAVVLDLDDLILGGFTAENHLGEQMDMYVISLQGFNGSKNYLAALEWQEFLKDYTASEDAWDDTVPDGYDAYFCTTEEMVKKIDEICEKYGLDLLGPVQLCDSIWAVLDAVGVPAVVDADRAEISEGDGYYYNDGTFQISGTLNLRGDAAWKHPIVFQYRSVKKTSFDTVYINTWDIARYEQWSYTTQNGAEVLAALSPENALIFCELKDAFVTFSIIGTSDGNVTHGEERMNRAVIEAIADCLVTDYSAHIAAPDHVEAAYYSDYADYIGDLLDAGAVVSYTIEQVDGRDDDELLIFDQDGTVREILTIRDGYVQTMGKGGGMHLCEYMPTEPIMDAADPNYVYIFRVIEQETVVEGAVQHDYLHIGEAGQGVALDTLREFPDGSYARCVNGQWQTVTKSEYQTMIGQYSRMTLDRTYIGEFFGEHTPDYSLFDTVYLPIAKGEVERDWGSIQAFLTERGYTCQLGEGTYSVADPKNPDSYLLGELTTVSGDIELANVGYRLVLGDAVREVRSVFQSGGAEHHVNVSPWRDGVCVPDVADQECFIKEILRNTP